jgi:hypothetical protein
MNLVRMVLKSFGSGFCIPFLCSSPCIKPFKQLGGWAELGAIYRYML